MDCGERSWGANRMRFKPGYFIAPCALIGLFIISFRFWLTTSRDRGFSWAFLVFSVLAIAIEFALFAWSADNRVRELEARIEKLTERVLPQSQHEET